jgi:Tfp pilus assembly protein PilF
MSFRPGLACLALPLLAAVGCASVSSGRPGVDSRASARPKDGSSGELETSTRFVNRGDSTASEASLEKAAAVASDPAEKAKAYVALGRSQLAAHAPQRALKSFYQARSFSYDGSVASEINRGIGEAYFDIGDFSLARRYLSKSLENGQTGSHDLVSAELVICCRAMDDLDGATEFRGRITQPLSPEVRKVLAIEPRACVPAPRRQVAAVEREEPPVARPQRENRATPPREEEPEPSPSHPLRVYSRANWEAKAPRMNIEPMGSVDKITVHHSGGPSFWSQSPVDTAVEIQKIQRYHQNEQKWADIGYHYIIDRSGAVWQGRKLQYQGAHARGTANLGNIGIVVLGNFLHQGISPAQKEGLETLIEKLSDHFNIPPQRIYTHREILQGKTDCPGPALARCVSEIRADLRRRLVAYHPQ